MNTIIGVYKITNTVTNDFYIGSSNDVKRRWNEHKCQSRWNDNPNNPLYKDMKKYGIDKFVFEILEEAEVDSLKEAEQEFIETLKPTYNNINAKGWNVERYKEQKKQYRETHKEEILEQAKQYRESHKEQKKQYYESNKEEILEQKKQYYESNKEEILEQKKQYYESNKEQKKQYQNKYYNQLCFYRGQTLTLNALSSRFKRQGIPHPVLEAKKYLLEQQQ